MSSDGSIIQRPVKQRVGVQKRRSSNRKSLPYTGGVGVKRRWNIALRGHDENGRWRGVDQCYRLRVTR